MQASFQIAFFLNHRSAVSAPGNTSAPFITGTLAIGATLTANAGTWSGGPAFTYQWKLGGVAVSGATAATTVASVAGTYSFTITGTNAGGSTAVTSAVVVVPTTTVSGAAVRLQGKDLSTKETGIRYESNQPTVNATWTTIGSGGPISGSGTDFNITFDGLAFNTHYRFRAVPFNTIGDASASPVVDWWTQPEFAPVLTGQVVSPYSQNFQWVGGAMGGDFLFQRFVSGEWVTIQIVSSSTASYLGGGLSANTEYRHRVVPISQTSAVGVASNVVTLTTSPAAPAHSALAATKGAIHLWRANEAVGASAMVDTIGGKNASIVTPGIYAPVFGSYKIIGGPDGRTDTSVFSNGNDGSAKIQATGLSVSVPFTIEAVAMMQEDGAIIVLDPTSSGNPKFYLFGSAAGSTGTPNIGALTPDGTVKHYVVTYGATTQKFYVNGVLVATSTNTLSATLNRATFCEWPDNGSAGIMNLSHSAIYPTALSAGDVSELHLSALAPLP